MTFDKFSRLLAGAVLMTSTLAVPAPALAQRVPGPGPVPVKMLTLPCCRCLDGSVQTVNISTGSVGWTVKPPVGSVQTAIASSNVAWTNALAPAIWLGTQNGQPGNYEFDLRFSVPNCTIRPTVTLSGAISADNGGTVSLIPASMTPVSGPYPFGFLTTTTFASGNLVPGTIYTLRVTVNNQSGPVGMVLKGTIIVRCPKDVIKTDPIEVIGDPVDPT